MKKLSKGWKGTNEYSFALKHGAGAPFLEEVGQNFVSVSIPNGCSSGPSLLGSTVHCI